MGEDPNKIYNYQQLLEDFQHLQIIHANKDRAAFHKLTDRLEKQYPCDINNCKVFARHYRDRTQLEQAKNMYYYNKSKTTKTTQLRNNIDMIFQQHCDKVHSYLLHSMLKFDANGEKFENVEAIKRRNQFIQKAQGRSFSANGQHHKNHLKRKKKSERYIMKRSSQIADSQEIDRKILLKRHKLGIPKNMTIKEELEPNMNDYGAEHLPKSIKDSDSKPEISRVISISSGTAGAEFTKSLGIGLSETKSASMIGAGDDIDESIHTSSDIDNDSDHDVDDISQYSESDEEYKLYPGIEEDREWTKKIQTIANDGNTHDQEIFKLLVEHMGIFRWQALHGFHFDQSRATSQIHPTFNNIKEV